MNDYSNYHLSFNDKMVNDGKIMFDLAKKGVDGFAVRVDGVVENVVIQEKFNNPNGDLKYILADVDTLKVGSIVEHLDLDWLVTTLVKDNPIYTTSLMQMCNNRLKGDSYSYSCILTSHAINEDENSFVARQSSNLLAYVQANTDTRSIQPEQRFVFGSSIYKVIGIDDYTKNGILIISMGLTTKIETDNLGTGVADNTQFGGSWL